MHDLRVAGHPKLTSIIRRPSIVLSQAVSLLGLRADKRETEDRTSRSKIPLQVMRFTNYGFPTLGVYRFMFQTSY
jgi:hypothetical protein